MRILICASSAPLPPMDGFHLLLDELVRGLRRHHEVHVVAQLAADEHPDATSTPELRLVRMPVRRRSVTIATSPGAVLRSRPLTDDRRVDRLWPVVEDELRRFRPDVVHVTSGRLAAMGVRLADRPTVLGAVDARHLNIDARAAAAEGLRRLALGEQARRVRRLITTDYPYFDHVTVVTEHDRAALLALVPSLRVTAIPNGVDTRRFRPDPSARPRTGQVVFTGTMDYAPNVTAARYLADDILPRLRARRPDATLVLAGRNPARDVAALDERPEVTVTGEVPDIRPWLLGSEVFAAPMTSGTGIKNKLLEAMACGLPCVVSPLSLQGIHVQDGGEVLVADGPEETAAALARVLDEPPLARRLGAAARTFVEREHGWDRVADDHAAIYAEVVAAHAARAETTTPRSVAS